MRDRQQLLEKVGSERGSEGEGVTRGGDEDERRGGGREGKNERQDGGK
jgi:hypothetical protein